MTVEKRQYKDSVFCDLFYSDRDAKRNLLALYNALYDVQYTDPEIIEKIRLEEVIFKGQKNDVAFIVNEQRIILSEHQSSVNRNMPLRSLLYIAREYEKIIPVRQRYKKDIRKT